VIDAWEHTYYRDCQNKRVDLVTAVVDKRFRRSSAESRLPP
jgi:superoxide dismutase